MQPTFKYKTEFTSQIRTVYASQQGDFISLASLNEIKSLAPESAYIKENNDLLYNVFNAAVVNRVNKNEDGLTSEVAAQIYKNFIHKPMNIEHKRSMVVGHIVNAGFSEYKTNKILDPNIVASLKDPLYLTLSAVAYKLCDPNLCSLLTEASDETSAHYNSVSTSWELGFNEFHILLGHKDISQGEMITDPKQVDAFSKYLKAYGGSGFTEDGTPVYRIITGDVLPLGCGYTTNPAADVEGVLVVEPEPEEIESGANASANTTEPAILEFEKPPEIQNLSISTEITEQSKNNHSQDQLNIVKLNSIMTLTDITDDKLSQISAASLKDFLAGEIEKASNDYASKLDLSKVELQAKQVESDSLANQLKDLQKSLDAVNAELNATKEAKAAEKAQSDFNLRMADLNEKYTLSEKDQEVVAKSIRGLDDASFASWFSDFEVLAEHKSKTFVAQQSQASVDDILDAAKPNQNNVIPPTVEELKAKMAAAWKVEDLVSFR